MTNYISNYLQQGENVMAATVGYLANFPLLKIKQTGVASSYATLVATSKRILLFTGVGQHITVEAFLYADFVDITKNIKMSANSGVLSANRTISLEKQNGELLSLKFVANGEDFYDYMKDIFSAKVSA